MPRRNQILTSLSDENSSFAILEARLKYLHAAAETNNVSENGYRYDLPPMTHQQVKQAWINYYSGILNHQADLTYVFLKAKLNHIRNQLLSEIETSINNAMQPAEWTDTSEKFSAHLKEVKEFYVTEIYNLHAAFSETIADAKQRNTPLQDVINQFQVIFRAAIPQPTITIEAESPQATSDTLQQQANASLSEQQTDVSQENESPWLHPALPSIAAAAENYEQVFSDHIPVLLTVPWLEAGAEEEIKIISWNVLEQDSFSGFGQPATHYRKFGENSSQTDYRHERIAAALDECVLNNSDVDFILLQEISADGELLKKITRQLGEKNWATAVTGKNNVVLYNPSKFTSTATSDDNNATSSICTVTPNNNNGTSSQAEERILATNLYNFSSIAKPEKRVEILNVYAANDCAPFINPEAIHEKIIKVFLDATPANTKRIVAGSLGFPRLPLTNDLMNITTSVISGFVAEDNGQGTLDSNGGYYSAHLQEKISRQQAKTSRLNPCTGQTYDQADLQRLPENTEGVKKLRPTMLIESSAEEEKCIPDSPTLTIFEYQKKLRQSFESLGDNAKLLVVRRCVNCNNEQGISICFPYPYHFSEETKFNKKLYYQFLSFLKPPAFQFSPPQKERTVVDREINYFQIASLSADLSHLVKAMDFCIALEQFEQEIAQQKSSLNNKTAKSMSSDQLNLLMKNTETLITTLTASNKSAQDKMAAVRSYQADQEAIFRNSPFAFSSIVKATFLVIAAATILVLFTGLGAVVGSLFTPAGTVAGGSTGAILGIKLVASTATSLGIVAGFGIGATGSALLLNRFFRPSENPLVQQAQSILDKANEFVESFKESPAENQAPTTLAQLTGS